MGTKRVKQMLWRRYRQGGAFERRTIRSMLSVVYYAVNRSQLKMADVRSAAERSRPGTDADARRALEKACFRDCRKRYMHPWEYFLYRFDELGDAEKDTFLADNQRGMYTVLLNEPRVTDCFRDKSRCYETFKPYFHRALFRVKSETPDAEITEFCAPYDRVIIKPLRAAGGAGIVITETADRETLLSLVRERGDCVVESLVTQCAFMASLHPQSVNTIRAVTFRHDDGSVELLYTLLRVGQGAAHVDNGCSGGILSMIDSKTGVVISDGADHFCASYPTHPDTGIAFRGLQIPRWDELVALVKELASVVPSVRLVGFDLALTDEGWLMIEGNHNPQCGIQIFRKSGIRPDYERMLADTPRSRT